MFRRDTFVLMAVALIGIVLTIYVTISQTPFFPKSLQNQYGDCPARDEIPAHRKTVLDDFESNWFGSSLLGLRERPIFQHRAEPQRVLRFTLLRSFQAELTIRAVETGEGRVRLIGKLMPGPDGCKDSKGCVVARFLTTVEQNRLSGSQARLLNLPSYSCYGGADGARWIVESSGKGDYRLWNEWSPQTGEVHDLGSVLLDLTGWPLSEVY